mgnify:CR=1 FL=1
MENLNKHIEHTLLKQDAKLEDFLKLFEEAKKYVEENNIKEWPNEEAIKLVDNKIIVRLSEEY